MQSFEFKPAVLRGRNNWTLDSGMLTRNGELFCSLADVDKARFGEMSSSRVYSAWLDLYQGSKRRRIACTIRRGDQHNRAFMALSMATLDELAKVSPELPVSIGTGGGARWVMFIVGAMLGVLGAYFLYMTLTGQAGDGEVLFSFLFGAGALMIGGWMARVFRPWGKPVTLTPSEASAHVAAQASNP